MTERLPEPPLPPFPSPEPERFRVGVPAWIAIPGAVGFAVTALGIGWLVIFT